jgi:hypothetical protein
VVGRKPTRSNGLTDYPRRDEQVKQLAGDVWGPCDGETVKQRDYGKGQVVWGLELRDIFKSRGIGPDFRFFAATDDASVDYIHRRVGQDDIYFVSNKNMRWEEVDCVFRVQGKTPQLWMPDTGEIVKQVVYRQQDGGVRVPLRLPPAGSVFVVFRAGEAEGSPQITSVRRNGKTIFPLSPGVKRQPGAMDVVARNEGEVTLLARRRGDYLFETAKGERAKVEAPNPPPPLEISGPWEVRFPKGWGAPASKLFPKLISWTDDSEDGVKYFSGVATYVKQFDVPAELLESQGRLLLDLGTVKYVADVTLNGQQLGILWKPPFRLDITDAAKPGKNRLKIEVANTWSNRLVGDTKLPESDRYCRTNMKRSLTWRQQWKDTPLLESGLIGPVRLLSQREVVVNLGPL